MFRLLGGKRFRLKMVENFCSKASAHLLLLFMAKSIHYDSASTAATCWTFIVTPTMIPPQLMAPKSQVCNVRLAKLY
jgi:hypothetical protein